MPSDLNAESKLWSARELQSRAVAGSWWTLAHVLISLPITFLASVVIARSLGPSPYGVLAALTVTLGLLGSFTNLGVTAGAVKFGSQSWARGDLISTREILGKSLGFNLLVQMPLTLLGVWVITQREANWVFPTIALSVVASSVLSSATLAVTLENRLAHAVRIAIVSNFFSQLVICIVARETQSGVAVWVSRALISAILLPLVLFALEPGQRTSKLRAIWPIKWPKGFWGFTWPTAFSSILGVLVFSRSEVLLLKWIGEDASAGIYSLAFGVAVQITSIIASTTNSLNAAAAGFVAIRKSDQKRGLLVSLRLTSAFSALVAIATIPLIANYIPLIYGEDFKAAAAPFVVIGLLSCFQAAVMPFSLFLLANGESKSELKSLIWAYICNLSLALILIPVIGIWGAILANGVGQLVATSIVIRRQSQIAQVNLSESLSSMQGMLFALCFVPFITILFNFISRDWIWTLPIFWIFILFITVLALRKGYFGLQSEDIRVVFSELHVSIQKPLTKLFAL